MKTIESTQKQNLKVLLVVHESYLRNDSDTPSDRCNPALREMFPNTAGIVSLLRAFVGEADADTPDERAERIVNSAIEEGKDVVVVYSECVPGTIDVLRRRIVEENLGLQLLTVDEGLSGGCLRLVS